MKFTDLNGKKATVMGLGLHGGGIETARFLARHGVSVVATDLRSRDILAPSIAKLEGLGIEYVLGEHRMDDFIHTDMVIKNPAVKPDSPYLCAAREAGIPIETDISLFLARTSNPVLAVTGSKGKSSTVSALAAILGESHPGCRLGGNITVSPLTFLESLQPGDPVILELSSWQLADIKGRGLLKPLVSAITNILPDHQNFYGSMEAYADDKKNIYREQDRGTYTLFNADDDWGYRFRDETPAIPIGISHTPGADGNAAWLDGNRGYIRIDGRVFGIVPEELLVVGAHNRFNLLCAGAMAALFLLQQGKESLIPEIPGALSRFPGVEHRMELCRTVSSIRFINDSAATIPEAAAAALTSLPGTDICLVTGGTDKALDFTPLADCMAQARGIYLLAGTGTEKLIPLLRERNITFNGPYSSFPDALSAAARQAASLPNPVVLLSPGCASFGMFLNEFDRGRQFRDWAHSFNLQDKKTSL